MAEATVLTYSATGTIHTSAGGDHHDDVEDVFSSLFSKNMADALDKTKAEFKEAMDKAGSSDVMLSLSSGADIRRSKV